MIFYLLLLPILALTWGCQRTEEGQAELFYEYGPPPTIWLNKAGRNLMAEQASLLDADIYDEIISNANQALEVDPNPTDSIFYEGLVSNNPRRLDMRQHFRDITNLVYLINAYVLTNKQAYAEQTMAIAVAWAKKYKPTGNDVNENKLRDFFYAFDIHRDTFSDEDRILVEDWLKLMASKQIAHWDIEIGSSNRHAKRMKIILMAGITFDNQEYIDFAVQEIEKILDDSLYPDGTSRDLERRDAIHYHNS